MIKAVVIILFLNLSLMAENTIQSNPQNLYEKLYELYNSKKYFNFISELKLHPGNLTDEQKNAFYAFWFNLINKPDESEKCIDRVMGNPKSALHDSLKKDLYSISVINNVYLGDYKKSVEQTKILLKDYHHFIKEKDKADYENSLIIWNSLGDIGKQEVVKNADTKVKMKRDLAGLYNIPVSYNNETHDFVFDTGANFSTITETYAKKLELIFSEGRIKVDAITGKKIDAQIAYAKSFLIGNMEIKNTVFLVLPDEDLSFAGGMYKISGIIGLPVIAEMGELIISREGELDIPLNASPSDLNNFLLDGFTPVVEVDYKSNPMCFTFDTGAKTTLLYSPFLKEYENEIKGRYELEDIKFGGAGGDVSVPGYYLKDIELKVSDDKTVIPKITLLSEPVKDKEEFMFGNLGQDFISKFDYMTINFKYMSVSFK